MAGGSSDVGMTSRSIKSTFLLDINSARRRPGEPNNRFRFPLARAGIRTPGDAHVSMRAVGGLVPLETATYAAFDKRFRVYMEGLPVASERHVTAAGADSRLAVAHGDYRLDLSVYATVRADMQPTIQLVPGVPLPDLYVYLLDEEGEPFVPGEDWTLQLRLTGDQARAATLPG